MRSRLQSKLVRAKGIGRLVKTETAYKELISWKKLFSVMTEKVHWQADLKQIAGQLALHEAVNGMEPMLQCGAV